METNNDSTNGNSPINTRVFKIVILAGLVLAPLIYLYENSEPPPAINQAEQTASQLAKTDIPSLENLVNTNPNFDNLINLSMAYINNQMPGRSIDYLKRAIALNPNSAIAYNNLGVAYIMLQQYQEGIDACTKALSIDTTFQLAKNNLKWGTDEKDKLQAILKTQEQTPNAKKDVAYYIDNGMVYFKLKNYDKAIEVWSKIGDLDKKNVSALNNIGTAFMMKGQIDDAIALFKKAIEYEPNNQLAKNNLAWAQGEKAKTSSPK